MGRRRRDEMDRLHHSSTETDFNGDMPEESTLFRDILFDMSALRVQWGLLSITTIQELDLSEEELAAMLLSQLDLRDTFIDTLSTKLNDIISKGHVLEEGYNYVNRKIWDLEHGDCDRWNSKQDVGRKIKDEDDDNGWNIDKKFNTDALNIKNEGNTDVNQYHHEGSESSNRYDDKNNESLSQYHDKVSESSVPPVSEKKGNSLSFTPVPELPTHSKNKSENHSREKGDASTKDSVEKDKFKAMVAMAFKAQGYGFLSGVKDKDDSNDVKLGKSKVEESLGKSKVEESDSSDDDSEPNAEIGHGWSVEGEQSITQQVEAAASETLSHSGYEYQAELGLYYDYTSGYYYNAENGLYYDPKTGTYFFFDHATHSYQFHSQVPVDTNFVTNRKAGQESLNPDNTDEVETVENYLLDEAHPQNQESLSNIPPSLRLMVIESGVEKVKVGELHLVTMGGGTIGRKPDNLIQLLDVNVSKVHAEIIYHSRGIDDHHYYIKDVGSNLGTYINGTCICVPGEPSDEIEIGHGWELQFGSVKMKCHMHPGYLSCNDCEPGLVLANLPSQSGQQGGEPSSPRVKSSVEKARKKILKAMRKKYALEGDGEIPLFSSDYEDRSKRRRKEKGSDNPYEKTEVASTETELRDNNKGFTLLQKMGWSKGQGLGKSQPGITRPIEASSTVGREGLGFGMGLPPPTGDHHKRKKILDVTKARFKKL